MTYSTSNPPALVAQGIGGVGKQWYYESTDAAATVDGTGYITNASELGMTKGDLVVVEDNDAAAGIVTLHAVSAINANGSADLTDAGSTIGTAGD